MFCIVAIRMYEFKFLMVSGYSTLVQFQSGTRNFMLFTQTVIINNHFTLSLTIINEDTTFPFFSD